QKGNYFYFFANQSFIKYKQHYNPHSLINKTFSQTEERFQVLAILKWLYIETTHCSGEYCHILAYFEIEDFGDFRVPQNFCSLNFGNVPKNKSLRNTRVLRLIERNLEPKEFVQINLCEIVAIQIY
ncbi:hypothetical protein BpHYR1_020762, partial [Brachionus plicatilis]